MKVAWESAPSVGDPQLAAFLDDVIQIVKKLELKGENIIDRAGKGSPEGVVTANRGSTFRRTDGGAGTCFYVKESGDGTNTGWVAK